jgi:hypothetical protein
MPCKIEHPALGTGATSKFNAQELHRNLLL